jgi:peptidoglycan L-alanyl-D-glutamate endopeptidase CwlK
MPSFSIESSNKLKQADIKLQTLLNEAIKYIDFTILCTYRGEKEQNEAYNHGKSKLQFPNSKHNSMPSKAVDIAPYHPESPHIRWNDTESFIFLLGYIKSLADRMGIKIRLGMTWSSKNIYAMARFSDRPHIELVEDNK